MEHYENTLDHDLERTFTFDLVLKYILAIGLLIVGINKFVNFVPMFNLTGDAAALYQALDEAGFILPFIGSIEILCGGLLIRKNTTPLGLVMLLPFSTSIMLFHIFLAPAQIFPALFVFGLNIVLIYKDRAIFSPVFNAITKGEDEANAVLKSIDWDHRIKTISKNEKMQEA